jgi:hypothetical protein
MYWAKDHQRNGVADPGRRREAGDAEVSSLIYIVFAAVRQDSHSHQQQTCHSRRTEKCPVIGDQVGHGSCDWGGPGVLSVLGEQP